MFEPVIQSVPTDFNVVRDHSSGSVSIPMTISDDGVTIVALDVRLWTGSWQGMPMHEFKFAIVVRNRSDGHVIEIFDRAEASAYIDQVRHLVLPCVLAAGRELLKNVKPRVIHRVTCAVRPPQKALSKHQSITDMILCLGYEIVRVGTDRHDRTFWLMARSGES